MKLLHTHSLCYDFYKFFFSESFNNFFHFRIDWSYTQRTKSMTVELAIPGQVNLDAPRWDQSTFWGRFKHFFAITDWRKALYSNSQLDKAKETVEDYRYTYVKILANKISRELFSMTVKFWMVFAQHSQKTWQFYTSNPVWLRYVFCARDWQHMTWSSNFIYRWGINYLWTQN